jgi:hypothetical protein
LGGLGWTYRDDDYARSELQKTKSSPTRKKEKRFRVRNTSVRERKRERPLFQSICTPIFPTKEREEERKREREREKERERERRESQDWGGSALLFNAQKMLIERVKTAEKKSFFSGPNRPTEEN